MARIRTIKPSFFKNEFLSELPAMARLLFIGLFCYADREGRLENRPKRLKAEIFPFDNADVSDLLSRLQSAGFVTLYAVGELKVIQISNFLKHQRITGGEAETESEFPAEKETLRKQLGNNSETTTKQLGNTEDDRKGKEGKGKEGVTADAGEPVLPSDNPLFETWQRWKKFKQQQHKFSYRSRDSEETAINQLRKLSGNNAVKATQIIEQSIASGYKGFFSLKDDETQSSDVPKMVY